MGATTTLFVCGDVMLGRGVDQALPHPGDSTLREPWVRDARTYLELAERRSGPLERPISLRAIWGDALDEWEAIAPAARLINLETSITTSDDFWPGKEIHYRMSPRNAACLAEAGVDACALANNHVLDFGYAGLAETLATLRTLGIATAGAGADRDAAFSPARLDLPGGGRLLVLSVGAASSGVPPQWAAGAGRPGVAWLPALDEVAARAIAKRLAAEKRPSDLAVASVHQGANWGWEVPRDQVRFAHALIEAGVDLVHGHSSHHPRPIEIHRRRLVLYGCGDFLNDYEGITGREKFRGDLSLMYFPTLDRETGELLELVATPMRIRNLRPRRAAAEDARWLWEKLRGISGPTGRLLHLGSDRRLRLSPAA